MKKIVIIIITIVGFQNSVSAQNLGGLLKTKAKQAVIAKMDDTAKKVENKIAMGSSAASQDTQAMEGNWKVDGVIVTTELEGLKSQIPEQEKNYNNTYKGYNWIFKKDGSISITAKTPYTDKVETGIGRYELQGEKILMEINGQPGEYDLKFEDGQMLLINTSPVNTIYYVFVKA